jgi:hypothetical protein
MTTTTLNIAKSLTVVTNNFVYTTNFSNLIAEASKYNVVNLNGVTKTEKLNKYLSVMLSKGYVILSENWNRVNTIADGVSDFSITLSK